MSDSFNSWNAPLGRFSGGGSSAHKMEQLGTQWNRSDTSSPSDGPRVFTINWDEYDSYRCGTPDLIELKLAIEDAKERKQEHREQSRKDQNIHLDGIGSLLCQLRGEVQHEEAISQEMKRIDLSGTEEILDGMGTRSKSKPYCVPPLPELAKIASRLTDILIPPGRPHPTDVDEIRRLVRSKMPRCTVCRSRFGERNLLERHLRDHHHIEYLEYIAQQEEDIRLQRLEEFQRNRLEELRSGGFIPPENELASASFDIDVNSIPLPGENTNGIVTRIDRNAILRQPPQCNFCDKRFPDEVSLKKHLLKRHHGSIDFVQCFDCFKCLSKQEDLSNHDCDVTFMCYECLPMRNLCNPQRLLLHRANVHRGAYPGFRCELCNLEFLTPRKLRQHKRMAQDHNRKEHGTSTMEDTLLQ